jgi:cyclophilin family peptidyl-prolyl cis-trans isomerase
VGKLRSRVGALPLDNLENLFFCKPKPKNQQKKMSRKNPLAFMDISIGSKPIGRVIFELFMDMTPKTSENFRGLCTGEYGNVGLQSNTKKLHFAGSRFHRIVEDFMIQGGDITKGDGSGGFSIYGNQFNDEDFTRRHSCAGLLSMANCGRNSNNSQFFITLKSCPHLDGKHVVFGQVTYGMEVVRKISKTVVDRNDKPRIAVVITACGELGDEKSFF